MLTLDDLREAVDAYTGALRFIIPIATVPGLIGPDWPLSLRYDSATVEETVTGWNLSHPTGPAGLGWTLPLDRIVVDRGDQLGSDQVFSAPAYVLLLGGHRYDLIPIPGGATGTEAFATQPHEFWRIAYRAADETWTVTLEDGTALVFGGTASGLGTVDLGVAWGNWSGASLQPDGRRATAVAWSLATRSDAWGNTTTFHYDQTRATLGGTAPFLYTVDTRLAKVQGPDGSSLILTYAAKEAAEYTDPFGGPAAPAWQGRYSTMALASVQEVAPGGAVVAVTSFDYRGPGGTLAAIGTGDHTKRLLTGLTRQAPDGYEMPGISLGYGTDPNSPSYGALTSVITTAGGEAAISYAKPEMALAKRAAVLSPPAPGDTDPRVFFGTDYALALWRATDGAVHATAYRWQGRWLPASVAAPPAADAAAYQALRVVCGRECFAIVGADQYTLFHTDPALPGSWLGSAAPEPVGLPAGEPVALAAGDGYIALAAGHSGTMTVRWFDGAGLAWQTLRCPAPAGTVLAALDGSEQSLVRIASTGGRDHQVLLAHPTPSAGGWGTSTFSLRDAVPALDTVAVTAGTGYAVVTLAGWAGADRAVDHDVLWWDTAFAALDTTRLSHTVGAPPPGGIAVPQVAGASVLIGQDAYRFDGAAWRHQDLSTLTHPNQSRVVALSLGADTVTRSVQLVDGSLRYDLIVYNPADLTATPWGYPAGMSGLTALAGATTASAARFAPGQPGAASRFVLLNNTLYQRAGDGTWPVVLTVQNTFDAATIASLTLGDSSYLAYQSATGVTAYPLVPGGHGASSSGIDLRAAKLLDASGRPLAGQNAFVSYTGTWGASDAVLTLHRAVAEDVGGGPLGGPLTPLTVTGVVLYANGGLGSPGPLPYDAVPITYAYAPATATVSDCGRVLQAGHCTVVEAGTATTTEPYGSRHIHMFNRLTAAERPARDYPTGPQTNAAANLEYLAGSTYEVRVLAQDQSEVLTDTVWWWASAVGAGVYQRARKEATVTDGVPGERVLGYHPDTGQLTGLDATLADGTQTRTTYRYWWEAYDPDRTLNLLAPVIQCMQYAGPALIRGSVTTWSSQWSGGPGHWAPSTTYLATSATPAEFTGWTGDAPPPQGWQLTRLIAERTASGLIALTRDALGRPASSQYSADGTMQLAAFGNADVAGQEAYHYNCEPYEDPGPWSYRGGTLEGHLVPESLVGTVSLQIAPDATGATGPVAAWTPSGQNRDYLFSCWVQTGAALVPGDATFVLKAHAGGQEIGSVTLTLPKTSGVWNYASIVVPLGTWRAAHHVPAGTAATITARGANTKTGLDVYVDALRFQPCDADFYAAVTDPATGLMLGSLQANGVFQRQMRDANRLVTATIGPDAATARLTVPAFARLAKPDGLYAAAFPNTLLESQSSHAADYHDFESSDEGLWTLPAGWTLGGGQLAYNGSSPGIPGSAAVLTGYSSPDYTALVRFQPATGVPAPDVGIGCGNVLAFHLAASQSWVLATTTDGVHWTQGPPHRGSLDRGDVVFALLDGRVTLFAAGRQVFSEAVPAGIVPDGRLRLCLTGPGVFRDLVVLSDPQLRLTLIDGSGRAQQSVDLRGGARVDALGAVSGPLGLSEYAKNPALAPLALESGRIAGAPTSYLPPVGPNEDALAHYLQYGNGSTFVRSVPEPTPLARLAQLGRPGDELAVGGDHATQVAYAQNTATGPMAGLVPAGQAGNYGLVSVTDPDHGLNHQLISTSGVVVAKRTMLTGTDSLTQGYTADAAGQLTAYTPPNGYASSDQAAWQTRYTRDFLGRVVAVDSPDTQHSQTARDAVGRVRFTQSAADAAATPALICYYRYDGIDRVIEEGVLSGVAWSVALAQVDNPAWPDAGVSRTVSRTMSYDVPAMAGAAHTEGRLAALTVFAADGTTTALSESYGYDTAGHVTAQQTRAPAYSADTWITGYEYDSRGNVTRIDYPRAQTDTGAPLVLTYSYDRDGNLTGVGEPAPGLAARYGRFQYNPDGSLAQASYQNDDPQNPATAVDYTYSPAGWLESVTSPVYTEQVGYTSGGYGGAGSFQGLPASSHRHWQADATALYPVRDYTAQYAYDPAGRLIAAAPYLAPNALNAPNSPSALPGQQSSDAVVGDPPAPPPLTLDANGNLLTVVRGDTTEAYRYPQTLAKRLAGPPIQPSDRLQNVLVTFATSCAFEAALPAGWSFGASDDGPGGSAVVDGGPAGKCLRVPGATIGMMAGTLAYRGHVDPRGTYTLRYQLKGEPGFTDQHGPAGWYLVLHGPGGPVATVLAAEITAPPSGWAPETVPFDLTKVFQVHGDYAQVVEVSFVLRNHRRGADGTQGAALLVDNLALTGTGDLGLEYNASGQATAVNGTGLAGLRYFPDSNTLAQYRMAATGGYTMEFARGNTAGYAVRQTQPDDPEGVPGVTLYLRDPDGKLLMRKDRWGGRTNDQFYVEGPHGVFAVKDEQATNYLIRAADSTVGAVIDQHGNLREYYDTDAFGAVCGSLSGGHDVLGRLTTTAALRTKPGRQYAPYIPRFGVHLAAVKPDDPRSLDKGVMEQSVRTRRREMEENAEKQGAKWMLHNPNAWFASGQVPSGPEVLTLARLKGEDPGPRASAGMMAAAASAYERALARAVVENWRLRWCQQRGMRAISPSTLIEDMFHDTYYVPLESLPGAKHLRLRTVEPIPDGFYIFVVTEWFEFRYRDSSDRAPGAELYVRHSELASGGCAVEAGMMAVFGNKIVLTNQSGHYGWWKTDKLREIAAPLLRAAGYNDYEFDFVHYDMLDLKKQGQAFRARTGAGSGPA